MKKAWIALALITMISTNANAFPNIKKYKHIPCKTQDQTNSYLQCKSTKLGLHRGKSMDYFYGVDNDTKTHILISKESEYLDMFCNLGKDTGAPTDESTETYLHKLDGKDVLYFKFEKGRFIFDIADQSGFFQTWENDSNRYEI